MRKKEKSGAGLIEVSETGIYDSLVNEKVENIWRKFLTINAVVDL